MSYRKQNRAAWNRLVAAGSNFAQVATDAECAAPLATLDGRGWLPASVAGWNVLCLAGGGGWQSILYAAAGAHVTVADLSPAMLQLDLREAARRGYKVQVLETSMDDLSSLPEEGFDIVHQPVSTCYVPDIVAVYREVARVLKGGGLYISQHKQPTNLQITSRTPDGRYIVGTPYYHTGPLPPPTDDSYREEGAVEYLHRWEDLVGGLCRNGLLLEDLREPYRGDPRATPGHFKHRGLFIPPYVRMKARRAPRPSESSSAPAPSPVLWTPS